MKRSLFLLSLLCLISSCGKSFSDIKGSFEKETLTQIVKKIDRDIVSMSTAEVEIVSSLYSRKSLTKSSEKTIKEIIPIKDSNGKILMYAVNYDDGYIIVSATKKYYPILADVERGTFSIEDMADEPKFLIEELLGKINIAETSENFPDLSKYWTPYIEPARIDIEKTKANSDYYDLFESYLEDWYADGCSVYYLYKKPENMPEDMYNEFYRIAENDMAEVNGYPFRECAVITEQTFETSNKKGPLLKTTWDQESGYNSQVPGQKVLGCVTVAVGQIMKYHEYPKNYDWANMANSTPTSTSASFLAKLRTELKVSDKGGTTDKHAKRVLKDYGYSCSDVLKHDNTKVTASLSKNNPVYMGGQKKSDPSKGHAWVCDGYMYTIPSRTYTLYLLTFENGKPSALESWYEETIYDSYPFFFHMNWGWCGKHNGYFLDSDIDLAKRGKNCNYSVDRTDIITSGHN